LRLAHERAPAAVERGRGVPGGRDRGLAGRRTARPPGRVAPARARAPRAAVAGRSPPAAVVRRGLRRGRGGGVGPSRRAPPQLAGGARAPLGLDGVDRGLRFDGPDAATAYALAATAVPVLPWWGRPAGPGALAGRLGRAPD